MRLHFAITEKLNIWAIKSDLDINNSQGYSWFPVTHSVCGEIVPWTQQLLGLLFLSIFSPAAGTKLHPITISHFHVLNLKNTPWAGCFDTQFDSDANSPPIPCYRTTHPKSFSFSGIWVQSTDSVPGVWFRFPSPVVMAPVTHLLMKNFHPSSQPPLWWGITISHLTSMYTFKNIYLLGCGRS